MGFLLLVITGQYVLHVTQLTVSKHSRPVKLETQYNKQPDNKDNLAELCHVKHNSTILSERKTTSQHDLTNDDFITNEITEHFLQTVKISEYHLVTAGRINYNKHKLNCRSTANYHHFRMPISDGMQNKHILNVLN